MEIKIKCTRCNGTGLYQRRTPYTVNGKPICFRCNGTRVITKKISSFQRLYHVKDAVGRDLLVPANKRKNYRKSRPIQPDEDIEIPF